MVWERETLSLHGKLDGCQAYLSKFHQLGLMLSDVYTSRASC